MASKKAPKLKIVYRKIADLQRYEANARYHSDEQVRRIAASMREFGFNVPILLDPNDEIIAGHGRLDAAELNGYEEAPTVTITGLTQDQIDALRIADNQIPLNATWDDALLAFELNALDDLGFHLPMTGFSPSEIAELRFGPPDNEEPEAPEQFASYDEDIETEHECEKCGYTWSGGK